MSDTKKIKVLCITRKYPPQVGGMETFSYQLLNSLNENEIEKKIIALGKKQIHLIWFLPYCIFYCIFFAKKWDIIFIGDAVLCVLNSVVKCFAKKAKTIINVFGLDITFGNKLYQKYLSLFYKNIDKYICISKETEKILKLRSGEYNSIVITPGIVVDNSLEERKKDWEEFRKAYNVSDNNLCLLTVGRLVKRKGVAWFLENVMIHLKESNILYFIIGDGEDKENIEDIVQRNDLAHCVRILGRVTEDALNMMYRNCDVFMMPNIHVENDMEGFGIVAVEAAAAGLLVVASGIEGIKDAIIPEKNGILLQEGNAEGYLDMIHEINDNFELWKQKIIDFSRYTNRRYNWQAIGDKYIEIFSNLVYPD